MALILKNGRVLDPGSRRDFIGDVVVHEERIRDLGAGIAADGPGVLDCSGLVISPGWIDLHVHLREPGYEYKETIETGTQAAVAGGFTAVCAMPNTNPVNDGAGTTTYLRQRAVEIGAARVYPVGAITVGSRGEALAAIGEMRRAGAVALSDDGRPVMNPQILRRAMEYAAMFALPIVEHAEDLHLAAGGVMHEGAAALRLGLRGISAESEAAMVERDILLARQTGAHLHIAHLSTALAVEAVRAAKARGLRVTAEVTPHHLTLCDEDIRDYDPNFKMNPPLRSRADREAVIAALADGTIDAIATDHAPHALHEKQQEFNRAPFGIIGLETALPLALRLVESGRLTLARMVEAFTTRPAAIFSLPGGRLEPGGIADITVFDPNAVWTCEPARLRSKSRNTPFAGWELKGRAVYTIIAGRMVFAARPLG
ncbi:MAG TPA: dihydroorotase [Terriglobales bacterium]|nr:dihydroorotase [Terriglobales bacterium]